MADRKQKAGPQSRTSQSKSPAIGVGRRAADVKTEHSPVEQATSWSNANQLRLSLKLDRSWVSGQ